MPTFGTNRKKELKNPPDWDAHAKDVKHVKDAERKSRADADAARKKHDTAEAKRLAEADSEAKNSRAAAIVKMNVADAQAAIEELASTEILDAIEDAEKSGASRKGVLEAIDKRRDEVDDNIDDGDDQE